MPWQGLAVPTGLPSRGPLLGCHVTAAERNGKMKELLYARLRREPRPFTVEGSLPVLFFGDLLTAEVATVGLNPSDREYLDSQGRMLTGTRQRFATLETVGAMNRAGLTDDACEEAVEWMRAYYGAGNPVYGWFTALERVAQGFGVSLRDGSCVHLDLVQDATRPTWSGLQESERAALLAQDLPFLEWEIRAYPLRAVICTGKTVSMHIRSRLGVQVEQTGELARIKWWIGRAEIEGREVSFAGWNYPLARPTGLGREGEIELGRLLAERINFASALSDAGDSV